ncbi:acyltransferase family protein [Ruminococcus sp.]|uniref:acyltransferase n=1 Tax=Ruminococcus sp. TaxID=41978 RepID=UPI001B406143|nr:acyltransferase family protein [Ruminococcus sp.]MBP5430678.1 acyltransferase family protein [Ruminococcus sp.]
MTKVTKSDYNPTKNELVGNKAVEKNKSRNSNIELLRIIAAIMVVMLHYNFSRAICQVPNGSVNEIVLYVLESISICAVNVFIMISGYFMVFSKKRRICKIAELLLQVIAFKVIVFGMSCVSASDNFSLVNLLKAFVPNNYYVIFYVALYFISLYLNIIIDHLSKKETYIMLGILIFLLSVYPTIVDVFNDFTSGEIYDLSTISRDGSGNGYTIVNFVLVYIIGAVIGKYKDDFSRFKIKTLVAAWFADVIIIFITSYFVYDEFLSTAYSYCNPFIILEAVITFLIFKNMNIQDSKIINTLAKGSFTVYLIHSVFLTFSKYDKVVKLNPILMVIVILITLLVIYILGWIIYEIWNFCYSKTIKNLVDRLKRFDISINA